MNKRMNEWVELSQLREGFMIFSEHFGPIFAIRKKTPRIGRTDGQTDLYLRKLHRHSYGRQVIIHSLNLPVMAITKMRDNFIPPNFLFRWDEPFNFSLRRFLTSLAAKRERKNWSFLLWIWIIYCKMGKTSYKIMSFSSRQNGNYYLKKFLL